MPLTPEEENRRRKAGDKDALGYFDGSKGGKKNSAFGVETTTEAPGVSISSKNEEKPVCKLTIVEQLIRIVQMQKGVLI